MERTEIQKTPSAEIADVSRQLQYPLDYVTQEILRGLLPQAWPVGSVFISLVSTDPSVLLGYGTWTAFGTGRVIVGIDPGDPDFDTVRDTFGSKTHTLTTAEMPAHTHGSNLFQSNGGGSNPAGGGGFGTGNTASEGGGGAHNNVQPSIVAYMWERTA